jgi:guanylate kinase
MKKLIVLSSPSGGGKTTVTKYIMSLYPEILFSVSATTREQRFDEIDGKDYYFLDRKEFVDRLDQGDLIEYEVIFGNYYGTLKSEIAKALEKNQKMIFDIDVKGALSIKKHFPNDTVLIFIAPPSLNILEERLMSRSTETSEQIYNRLTRAKMEMEYAEKFDYVVPNDKLNDTLEKVKELMEQIMA